MTKRINDISFASGYSLLFAACGGEDIRVYSRDTGKELLRITVPNLTCTCVHISQDGKAIVSGMDYSVVNVTCRLE